MSVDGIADTSTNAVQAQRFADLKKSIEDQETMLAKERSRVEVERKNLVVAEENKTDGILLDISTQGEQQAKTLQKANTARIHGINQAGTDNFNLLAENTAKRLKELDAESAQRISNYRLAKEDKLAFVEKQSEDPFYHLASFHPELSETQQDYQIKMMLPPHEAKNLFISSEPRLVKLSLARTFQDAEKPTPTTQTKSSSYQTILESIQIPGSFDAKKISREYADGMLTIRLPKV